MAGYSPLDHQPRTSVRTQPGLSFSALKIVLCYLLFAGLWVLLSDQLLLALIKNSDSLTRWQTLKGWAFILITAVMLYALISRSLSAIQKSSAALQKSDANLRHIVESDMVGIVFWSMAGKVLDANNTFLNIVGYTRDELAKGEVNWLEMMPEESGRLDEQADVERRLRGSSRPYEKQYVRKDGSRVSLLIGIATFNESEEKHVAFVLDITERRRVEEALRKSERQLREILENIQLVAVMFDREGTLIFCNHFMLGLTGRRLEDVIARNWFNTFVPADQRNLIRFTFTEMFKKGLTPSQIEYEIQTHSGERRTISWSNMVLRDAEGKAVGITCIGEDVTERKLSEERLRSSYKQSCALSSHLQSVREEERIRIARELQNVLGQTLTGLKMDVWWLIKSLWDIDKVQDRPALLKKCDSMSSLINSTIVSVRKLATELRPGVLDDLGLVAAIEWQAREFQAQTGIVCHLSIPAEEVDIGAQRDTAVFRIFQEILTNIARHARARNVEVRMKKTDGDLRLEVKDDGRGIAENKISGAESLGLLEMRERAMLFGGEVIIRQAQGHGHGTIVTVRIPLRSVSRQATVSART